MSASAKLPKNRPLQRARAIRGFSRLTHPANLRHMSRSTQTWTCACGQTQLAVETSGGSRVVCYCRDCQAFARHFGRTDMLDGRGGSDLYQVQPHQVTFLKGEENLAALRLSGKGPARWYAACCGTPMANTWTSPKVPFATMTAAQFSDRDILGPIHAQAFRRDGLGYVEKEGTGMGLVYLAFARRALTSFASGNWRKSPFFDEAGAPKAEFRSLTDDERTAAYDTEQTV